MELVIRGNVLQLPAFGRLDIMADFILGILDGKILALEKGGPGPEILDPNTTTALKKAGLSLSNPTYYRLQVLSPAFDSL
jgi:hypothetical protein